MMKWWQGRRPVAARRGEVGWCCWHGGGVSQRWRGARRLDGAGGDAGVGEGSTGEDEARRSSRQGATAARADPRIRPGVATTVTGARLSEAEGGARSGRWQRSGVAAVVSGEQREGGGCSLNSRGARVPPQRTAGVSASVPWDTWRASVWTPRRQREPMWCRERRRRLLAPVPS